MFKKLTNSENLYVKRNNDLINPKIHKTIKPLNVEKGVALFTLDGTLDKIVSPYAIRKGRLRLKPIHKLPSLAENVVNRNKVVINTSVYYKRWRDINPLIRKLKDNDDRDDVVVLNDLTPLFSYDFSGRKSAVHKYNAVILTLLLSVVETLENTNNHCIIIFPTDHLLFDTDYNTFKKGVITPNRDYINISTFNQYLFMALIRMCADLDSPLNNLDTDQLKRISFLFPTEKGTIALPGLISRSLNGENTKGMYGEYYQGYHPSFSKLSKGEIIKSLFGFGTVIEEQTVTKEQPSDIATDDPIDFSTMSDDDFAQLEEEQRKADASEKERLNDAAVMNTVVAESEFIQPINEKAVPPKKLKDRLNRGRYSVKKRKKLEKLHEKANALKVEIAGEKKPLRKLKVKNTKIKKRTIKVKAHYQNEQFGEETISSSIADYIENNLPIHLHKVFDSLNDLGFIVTKVEKVNKEDLGDRTVEYRVKIHPIDGAESTINIILPDFDKHGTMRMRGIDYLVKFQKADKPIVKSKPYEVILSSYMRKFSVLRNETISANRDATINRILNDRFEDSHFDTHVSPIPCYDGSRELPKSISGLSLRYSKVTQGDVLLDLKNVEEVAVNKEVRKGAGVTLSDTLFNIGKVGSQVLVASLLTDKYYTLSGHKLTYVGDIVSLLKLDERIGKDGKVMSVRIPKDTAVVKMAGKVRIPVAIILTQLIGIKTLLKLTKVKVKFHVATKFKIHSIPDSSIIIKFKDTVVEIIEPDYYQTLLLSGFYRYTATSSINYNDFNKQGKDNTAIPAILSNDDLASSYRVNSNQFVQEVINLYDLFIDPITADLLETMNEPNEFIPLLLKAVRYLTNDTYPEEMDAKNMIIRGYERIPGLVYKYLSRAIMAYRRTNLTSGNKKLNFNPFDVKTAIMVDETKEPVSAINIIDTVKQRSAVLMTGDGGRKASTLVNNARRFTPDDLGIVSGSTSDSGKVGIVANLSASPRLDDIYGNSTPLKDAKDNPAAASSVTELMSPGIEYDDPKRRNFANIHDSHQIGIEGDAPFIRGGYAPYLARRVTPNNMFSIPSEGEGKVLKVTDDYIEVKYKGKDKPQKYSLGTKVGASGGKFYRHYNVANVKKGDKVDESTLLGFNPKFFSKTDFEPDVINTNAIMGNVALFETMGTWEDSSTISESLAKRLKVQMTKRKILRFDGKDNITSTVKIGQEVTPLTPLAVISDSIADVDGVSKDDLENIKVLMTDKPLASYLGTVVSMTAYYTCDIEDMSETTKAFVKYVEREMNKLRKADGLKPITGKVSKGYKVKGEQLADTQVAIYIDIDTDQQMNNGSKLEYGYMFKSVVSGTFPDNYKTKTGVTIDAFMSFRGIMNRVTNSPFLLLAGSVADQFASKNLLEAYNK